MKTRLVVAAVQMNSRTEVRQNLATATRLVEDAAGQGAQLVALPELFNCLGPFDQIIQAAEPIPGPTSEAASALASRLGIFLLAGSICERSSEPSRGYNTSLLFGPDGELLSSYRKMHLFHIDFPSGISIHESQHMLPGDRVVSTPTPLAHLGQATCYDLRFPELFRVLVDEGTEVYLVPSAFTKPTGRDHWEILLRVRAIENQSFVIAPNQCGAHTAELISYGHSAIVDPWGRVLASAGAEDQTAIVAQLDGDQLAEVRRRLPALANRRSW